MRKDWVAWMPMEHEDRETAQYLLAISLPKGRTLGVKEFKGRWPLEIVELMERSGDLKQATEHLASHLEGMGLLPEWVDQENAEQMLDPDTNPRIADLLGAWGIFDLIPNKPLTENKKAAQLIQDRDSSTWVDSLRYP